VIGDLVFRPLLRDEDLALERNVILEEIGMVEDTPDDLVFERHHELLWGAHPYGYSILGTRDTVARSPPTTCARCTRGLPPGAPRGRRRRRRRARRPGRRARGGRLGRRAPGRRGADARRAPRARGARVRARGRPRAHQTHVVVGSAAPAHNDDRRDALALVSMVLGGGMSSRLFQTVREELGLAYSVHTFQSTHVDAGMHGVYLATAPEDGAQGVRRRAARAGAASAAEGLPDDELAAAKRQLRGQITLAADGVTNAMYRAAGLVLYDEPFRPLDEVLARVDAVAPTRCARCAPSSSTRPADRA
jgi:predicted Zn-dependent peptidase